MDIKIKKVEDVMIRTKALLVKKDVLRKNIYSFILETEEVAKIASPGQFIDIFIDGFTLRRPISICEVFSNAIRIVFGIRGKGTERMANWQEGKNVDIIAPLGHGFNELRSNERLLVVGGGIGTPPLLELAKRAKFVKSILGFRTKDMVILEDDYSKLGETVICTSDGTYGKKGFVTEYVLDTLKNEKIDRIAVCGPKPMLKAIAEIANKFNIFCEVSMEERMACGVGACLGCQCMVNSDGNLKSAHVCKDGPVFNACEVII